LGGKYPAPNNPKMLRNFTTTIRPFTFSYFETPILSSVGPSQYLHLIIPFIFHFSHIFYRQIILRLLPKERLCARLKRSVFEMAGIAHWILSPPLLPIKERVSKRESRESYI
jgi:hypothetical protein